MRLADIVLSGFAAALFSTGAIASNVTYSFSTGAALDHGGSNDTNVATRGASQATANSIATFLSGSSVSGSLVYDASSPVTNIGAVLNGHGDIYGALLQPDGTIHSSFSALSASVNGASAGAFSFSDPRGITIVGNDASPGSCLPVPPANSCTPPLVDLFQLQAESNTHNIVPFSITVGGSTYSLVNARFMWQEGALIAPNTQIPDFLTSNALLATPPSFHGTLSLDFVNAANPAGTQYFAFYDGLSVAAAVPEPQTYALFITGILLLGFTARVRNRHSAFAAS